MGSASKGCLKTASHLLFKARAKNRVDDLQGIFSDLQSARKESRVTDAAILEEQVQQMLREWKAELSDASPASSVLAASLASSELSSDMRRLLQLHEEDDDATSILATTNHTANAQFAGSAVQTDTTRFEGELYLLQSLPQEENFDRFDGSGSIVFENLLETAGDVLEGSDHVDGNGFSSRQELAHNTCLSFAISEQEFAITEIQCPWPGTRPPPSAFLGPKCALWDCPRPAQGSDWCQDYCSNFHSALALNEGPPGMTPVMRPRGIDLKDGPLFAALSAKTHGKAVGIPVCEGAATTKSPWNAPELFDLFVLEGEVIREWLFFDKPRRAFESGNRKQRSLPDYMGRGWHESRKQVMKEFSGLKRSYYMDPQPSNQFEWHLYEYEINNCDAIALYRLELKQVDGKKNPKLKLTSDTLKGLQHRIGRLSADPFADNKESMKNKVRLVQKSNLGNTYSNPNRVDQLNDDYEHGGNVHYGYFLGNTKGSDGS